MKKRHKKDEGVEVYVLTDADLKELGFTKEEIQNMGYEQDDVDELPYTYEEIQLQARIVKAAKKLKSAKIKLNLARVANVGLLVGTVVSAAMQGFSPLTIALGVDTIASLGLTFVGKLKRVEARGDFWDYFGMYSDYLDELYDPFPEFREGYSEEKEIEEKVPPKQTEKTREL